MARRDDSQREGNTPSRVYKAGDVHKRRFDRKGRSKGTPRIDEGAASDDALKQEDGREAVVLAPEFGRRSEAQRESDDRWFAAMRDAGAESADEAWAGWREEPQVEPAAQSAAETAALSAAETGRIPASETTSVQDDQSIPRKQRLSRLSTLDIPQVVPETASEATSDGASQAQAVDAAAARADSEATSETAKETADAASTTSEADSEASEPAPETDEKRPHRRPSMRIALPKKHRVAIVVAAVAIVAIAVGVAFFTWNRWYRFDDHADLQGQWYVYGTAVAVSIDKDSIHLTDDVTYDYVINPQDKTISYTFGPMSGQGRYWFSDDRQYLVITDGSEFTSAGTAIEDLLHAFADLPGKVTSADLKLPEGEGIIALSRTPDPDALAKQEADAKAKAAEEEAKRKAEEEAKRKEQEEYEYYYYDDEEEGESSTEESSGEGGSDESSSAEGDEAGNDGGDDEGADAEGDSREDEG